MEEMIVRSILVVRGRAGARWNRMDLRNIDPMIPKTIILIIESSFFLIIYNKVTLLKKNSGSPDT